MRLNLFKPERIKDMKLAALVDMVAHYREMLEVLQGKEGRKVAQLRQQIEEGLEAGVNELLRRTVASGGAHKRPQRELHGKSRGEKG